MKQYKDYLKESICKMEEKIKDLDPFCDQRVRIESHLNYCRSILNDTYPTKAEKQHIANPEVAGELSDIISGDFFI